MNLAELERRLRRAQSARPGLGAIERAAQRAVTATNATLRKAGVPAHAQVTRTGQGLRVGLVQTGRIDRPFVGRNPRQLLTENVRKEMQAAKAEIAAEARRTLQ